MELTKLIFLCLIQDELWSKQIKAEGPRIWNAIPNYIKIMTSINAFLKHLKAQYN